MTTVGQALSVKEAKAQTQELLQDVEVGTKALRQVQASS